MNICYITFNERTSLKNMGRNKNTSVQHQNDFKSKSSFKQSGSKWMLTVNWRSVESRSSWERLTRVAGEEWLIIVCLCVCVFMIIIHVELLWYNEASWGASAALNLCCPSSFIKHTEKCRPARPWTHKHTKISQVICPSSANTPTHNPSYPCSC